MMQELKLLKNKKIGLVVGGISPEREVALNGGKAVEKALKNLGLKYVKFDLNERTRKDIFGMIKRAKIDVVFMVLHGSYGEDGRLQGGLDMIKVPYIGSDALSSAVAMDKVFTKQILIQNGIPTPAFEEVGKGKKVKEVKVRMKLPLVVKPVDCGSTIGISIVKTKKELNKALKLAFKYSGKVFVEKYINGTEITVPILNDTALPVIEIIPKTRFYDYKAKYVKGMSTHILPARLPEKVYAKAQELAVKTHMVLGLKDFSRVDFMVGKNNKLYVLEINSLPGLTATSLLPEAARFSGVSFEEMVLKMLVYPVKNQRF